MRTRPEEDAEALRLRFVWKFSREEARSGWPPHLGTVLAYLASQPDGLADQQAVGEELELTSQTVSRVGIDAEARGWVIRSRAENRRFARLRLTAAGRTAIGKIIHAAQSDE